MNILDTIVAYKKEEVALAKKTRPEQQLQDLPHYSRTTLSLTHFLSDASKTGIIAEFKRRSPSKGVINAHATAKDVTGSYAASGASGLSILTDGPSFGGSVDDLLAARHLAIPILRKEFIVDAYQVIESRANGADAILLIAAILSKSQVVEFAELAHGLGMQVILEVHAESELEHICDNVDIIGVNNRDLKTFTVSLEQSARLAPQISGKVLISESGIHSVQDIMYLKGLGFDGFLIGEAFMKEQEPGRAFDKFVADLKGALV